jgi:hypothetical protein
MKLPEREGAPAAASTIAKNDPRARGPCCGLLGYEFSIQNENSALFIGALMKRHDRKLREQ